uniref:Uncharacterized protein n=1 Tax=Ciona savignyi TaxID=51511 RepID=H2ZDX4_CIOSA
GTFRVGFPQPQTVENENEFVTNSGRRLKFQENNENAVQRGQSRESNKLHNKEHATSHPGPPTQFENPQLGISDSLQAQLHLSLDRLSENFYDP